MNDFYAFPIEKNLKKNAYLLTLKNIETFPKATSSKAFLWPKHLSLYSKYNMATDKQRIYAIKTAWKCNKFQLCAY